MRITIVYRFFPPDTAPYALLLTEMIPGLVAAGHEVNVIAGYPAYGPKVTEMSPPKCETLLGANVHRMALLPGEGVPGVRAVNMALFCVAAFLRILFGTKRDVFWCGSTPPAVQPWLIGLAAKLRGAKMIYQIQDIHPEIGLHSGKMKPGIISRTLTMIDNWALRRADRVTVLSEDMADVIELRSNVRPTVLNNFALGLPEDPDEKKELQRDGPVRFAYAGNIGQFQNLTAVVTAFAKVSPALAELHLLGDGKAKAGLMRLVEEHGLSHVYFYDRCSQQEAFAFLRKQEVGVVSLEPGLYRLAYPTKLHSYFAAGLKVFALLEEESRLAQLILKYDVGDIAALDRTSAEIALRIEALAKTVRSEQSHSLGVPKVLWHKDAAIARWLKLLDELKLAAGTA